MKLREEKALAGAEVPILGAGASGQAVAGLLRGRGMVPLLFDETATEASPEFRPRRGAYPFGVVSPGFAPGHSWRERAARVGLPLLGEVEVAASAWRGGLLCVTGTNGKTTLTRLLERALAGEGSPAKACGNIGYPFSALAADPRDTRWAVCEVSSFQLFDWARPSADAAIWTNFAEDHLDWHPSKEDYFRAKWRLVEGGMPVFVGPDVPAMARSLGLEIPETFRVVVPDAQRRPQPGLFEDEPFAALYALADAWWRYSGRDPQVLERAAANFEPLPHRMELVATRDRRRFINDSKATNFHAALAACRSTQSPIHWIGGGSPKGGDLAGFVREIASRVESVNLLGETATELAPLFRSAGHSPGLHGSLREAVAAACSRSTPGSTILFSPGFASFDQFSNYAERGQAFRQIVESLEGP